MNRSDFNIIRNMAESVDWMVLAKFFFSNEGNKNTTVGTHSIVKLSPGQWDFYAEISDNIAGAIIAVNEERAREIDNRTLLSLFDLITASSARLHMLAINCKEYKMFDTDRNRIVWIILNLKHPDDNTVICPDYTFSIDGCDVPVRGLTDNVFDAFL